MNLINPFKKLSNIQKYSIIISLIILAISLTQPAFYIDREEDPAAWAETWILFFFGWTFPFGGGITGFLFWLANPIYIISIIKIIRNKRSGFILSLIASLIATSFSFIDEITANSSGSLSKITSLELGYKLWLSSLLILTIGTSLSILLTKKKKDVHHV